MTESDLVFQMNWLADDQIKPKGIKLLQTWLKNNVEFCSEADTKPAVEAILRGLGWDTLTGDVAREGDCGLGDFHLYYKGDEEDNRKICALIEAEPLHYNANILQGGPLSQLDRYLRRLVDPLSEEFRSCTREVQKWISKHRLSRGDMVFACGVLTNGRHWWVYPGPKSVADVSRLAYPPPPGGEFDVLRGDDLDNLRVVLGKDLVCAEVEKFLHG